MKLNASVSLLSLVAASAVSSAQEPAISKSSGSLRSHVEFGVVRETVESSAPTSDYTGYYHNARLYITDGWFLTLEHFDLEADFTILSPIGMIEFLGFGAGYTWSLGSGRLSFGVTHGELDQEIPGLTSFSVDQIRYRLAYELELVKNLTLSASLCHFDTDSDLVLEDKLTTGVLGLGYAFGNGLSVHAQYSPDAAIIGVDDPQVTGGYTLGLRFEF